jgi:hypothetical protein
MNRLSKVFPIPPGPEEDHIHIVVRDPHAGQSQSVCLAVSIAHHPVTSCPIHNAINDHPPLPRIITHAVIACLSSPSQLLIACLRFPHRRRHRPDACSSRYRFNLPIHFLILAPQWVRCHPWFIFVVPAYDLR